MKCLWIFGHCWHNEPGSKPVPIPKNNRECKFEDEYVHDSFYGWRYGRYVLMSRTVVCGKCGKTKIEKFAEYNPSNWPNRK